MLEGKCKEDFEKWYGETLNEDDLDINNAIIEGFTHLPFSMQSGVYLEFFDSVGICIGVNPRWCESVDNPDLLIYEMFIRGEIHSPWLTRQEALKEAITKANEIYNKK